MNADFWSGMATGMALIVAIGSQNAYVLRQGIRREHVLPLVLFCSVSDAVLILAGIGGAGLFHARQVPRRPAANCLLRRTKMSSRAGPKWPVGMLRPFLLSSAARPAASA